MKLGVPTLAWALAAPACALAAGCFNPSPTQRLPCAPDGWCPPPEACGADGFCSGGSGGGDPDAAGPAPNVMFVTSQLFTASQHVATPVEDADALCSTLGSTLSPGKYVAWLSTSTTNAADRLRSFGKTGWVRPDGKPVANTVDDFVNNHLFYPPRLDEHGTDLAAGNAVVQVLTTLSADCTTGGIKVGLADGDGIVAIDSFDNNCLNGVHLYCFEVERAATVTPRVDLHNRFIFVSNTLLSIKAPNINQGIDDLDTPCAAEGAALDSSRRFIAIVAEPNVTSASRFNTAKAPWMRPDGVVVTSDLATLAAPISVTPTRDHIASFTWHGAADTMTAGTTASTCTDWTATSGTILQGVTSRSQSAAFSGQSASCATAARVYCAEP